ncbi:DUF2189 domain-containing protein [Acidiphilium iwatense]|uniref:DUF2189 domain-containing protein n=1 Tax=Acidiphilium iwatense TaxID=768198 RepID=A0ABS9DR77_9PROT|nr:DUF2189 domain-containing protein [Acidiphilium iwatense]MCF3945227.1 DUF2189 domain-containing protein [Acidiphilium iwatense]
MHIRNPIEWVLSAPPDAAGEVGSASEAEYWPQTAPTKPEVRRITTNDLRAALALGLEDFKADRTDVVTLAIVFPIAGLFFAAVATNRHVLPLIFPLIAGFALIGPLASIWLYELSRRREAGESPRVIDAIRLVHSPQIGSIVAMGIVQICLFLLWLGAADLIYLRTLGPAMPVSFSAFARATLTTLPGWEMIVLGIAVGFVFAVIALAIGAMSFPMLLDRKVDMPTALRISARALYENPKTLFLWGCIVAVGLAIGSLPALLGIAVVLPILGHSTWHLYRRVIG